MAHLHWENNRTALLAAFGEVVTRDELQKRLWPGGIVVDFDSGLNKAINRVREALGDDADNPRFIETVPQRGYRFLAQVEASAPAELPLATPAPETIPIAKADLHRCFEEEETSMVPWQLLLVGSTLALFVMALLRHRREIEVLRAKVKRLEGGGLTAPSDSTARG
jgi:Transcriptional regulatory protein, C terminal